MVQAVSHKFGATVSRVAYLRVPWFGKVGAMHCMYNSESENFELSGNSQTTLTINSNKLSKRIDIDRLSFHAYKEHTSNYSPEYTITLEADSLAKMFSLVDQQDSDTNFQGLLDSITVSRDSITEHSGVFFVFLDVLKRMSSKEDSGAKLKEKLQNKHIILLQPLS